MDGADIRIAGNPVTEGYVEAILDPETRLERLKAEGDSEELVPAIEERIGEVDPRCAAGSSPRAPSSSRTECRSRPTAGSGSTRPSRGWADRAMRHLDPGYGRIGDTVAAIERLGHGERPTHPAERAGPTGRPATHHRVDPPGRELIYHDDRPARAARESIWR